jgi:hypothetical protein
MSPFHSILAIVFLAGFCFGCDAASDESARAAGKAGAEDASFVTSLVDRARELLPASEGEAGSASISGNSAVARSGGDTAAIVRCEVKGKVTFTRAAQCDNAGGYGEYMALKGKNSAP